MVAARGLARALRHRIRRPRPDRDPAHRRAGRARRLDPSPPALRDNGFRRRRGPFDPVCARRVLDAPRDARVHRRARGRLPPLALERGDLPSGRAGAARGRALRADRPRRLHPAHGRRRGGGRGARRAGGGSRRRARRLLSGRPRPGDRAVPRGERRVAHDGGSRRVRERDRGAGPGAARRGRGLHLRAMVPGAGARPDGEPPRRVRPPPASVTTAPTTCTRSPKR